MKEQNTRHILLPVDWTILFAGLPAGHMADAPLPGLALDVET
jgi:hypothetical protein